MLIPHKDAPRSTTLFAGLLGAVLFGFSAAAGAFTGDDPAAQAIISLKHAEAIALKADPGRILIDGLGNAGPGGPAAHYAFAIRRHNIVKEVVVDARNGKLLLDTELVKLMHQKATGNMQLSECRTGVDTPGSPRPARSALQRPS